MQIYAVCTSQGVDFHKCSSISTPLCMVHVYYACRWRMSTSVSSKCEDRWPYCCDIYIYIYITTAVTCTKPFGGSRGTKPPAGLRVAWHLLSTLRCTLFYSGIRKSKAVVFKTNVCEILNYLQSCFQGVVQLGEYEHVQLHKHLHLNLHMHLHLRAVAIIFHVATLPGSLGHGICRVFFVLQCSDA